MGKGEEVYENLAALARREGAAVVYMKTGDWVETGELTLTCLYAGEDFGGKDRNSTLWFCAGIIRDFICCLQEIWGKNRRAVWSDWQNRRGTCRIYI